MTSAQRRPDNDPQRWPSPQVRVVPLGFAGGGWDVDDDGHPVIVLDPSLTAMQRRRTEQVARDDIAAAQRRRAEP